MVTDKAKKKARNLAFWQKHGLEAMIEAFGVSRRSLFLWKSRQKAGNGSPEALNEKSTRPKGVRRREWSSIYPKTPKMNARRERFSRTIQEEFIDCHASELLDTVRFNDKILDWLL